MREYVKTYCDFWVSPLGRRLQAKGMDVQLTALYLSSCTHANFIGLFRLPLKYIEADLNVTADEARRLLVAVEETGFAHYDFRSETLWLKLQAYEQIGELKLTDNNVKAVQREFENVPADCPYIDKFYYENAYMLALRPRYDMRDRVNPEFIEAQKAAGRWKDEAGKKGSKAAAVATDDDF